MIFPRRSLAALMALLLLSGMVVEGLAASLCPPDMQGHAAAVSLSTESGAHAGMHHQSGEPTGDSEGSHSSAPPCAPGMAGAGSSCLAVPLPASASDVNPVLPVSAVPLLFVDGTHDELVVSPHFRPPRA
jgi:hypothetical protein